MDNGTKIFLIGSIGALAPEVVRLYALATGGKTMAWSPGFYIPISLVFAALGGFIAMILPSENVQSAFYAGIATPVLITTVLKKARGTGQTDNEPPAANKAIAPPSAPARRSRVDNFLRAL